MNLVLEPKKSAIWENRPEKKMAGQVPLLDFRESLTRLLPSLHPCGLCAFLGICFEIPKALAGNLGASPCSPSGGRTLPGWRLPPSRIFPAQLPFEKELGAPVPTCWDPSMPSAQGCKVKKAWPTEGSEGWWGMGDWEIPSEPGFGFTF